MTAHTVVDYLDQTEISDSRTSEPPRSGQTVSGYGTQIPTRHEMKINGRWHRVYAMQYGNSGRVYVRRAGRRLFLAEWDWTR